jgi:HD-like signal output (HDOD) protein
MLGFLSRLFGRTPVTTAPDAAPASTSSAAPPRATRTPARAATPVAAAPVAVPAASAQATAPAGPDLSADALARELVHRAERFAQLFRGDAHADARAVAASLAADPAASVRQLPAAAQQALALTQAAEPSLPRLVAAIERDPTLAQSVLRHANSALFAAAGRPCYAVVEALGRIGVSGARQAVIAYTMEALICRPGDTWAAMSRQVWEHMVRTAGIARALAPAFAADADEAAALALLHDVGKLLMFDRLATLRSEWKREPVIAPEAMRVLLREFHEPLGGVAMHRWSLGLPAATAIATHHRAPAPAQRDVLGEVLFLAEAADLAIERHGALDLEALWITGRLTGSAVRAEQALREVTARAA